MSRLMDSAECIDVMSQLVCLTCGGVFERQGCTWTNVCTLDVLFTAMRID